jgi:hypothetical protein
MKPHAKRTSRRRTTGLLFCCLLAAVCSSLAQTNWDEKWEHDEREGWNLDFARYSREDVKAAQAKGESIDSENKKAKEDEWAGSYSMVPGGEVSLENLRWSPQAGFVNVYVYTCESALRYLNFGSVTVSPTTVQMLPEYPPASGRKTAQVEMYVKVKWGDRHYLIEEDRLEDFCDSISGTGIHKEGILERGFWLKSSDWEKKTHGQPLLPPEYKHLLKKPVDAKVIAVGNSYVERDEEYGCMKRTVTPVTLNVGSKSGVKAGMAFRVLSPKDVDYYFIKVLTVSPNTSSALYIPHGYEMCDESETPPDEAQAEEEAKDEADEPAVAVGWKLTTRPVEQ